MIFEQVVIHQRKEAENLAVVFVVLVIVLFGEADNGSGTVFSGLSQGKAYTVHETADIRRSSDIIFLFRFLLPLVPVGKGHAEFVIRVVRIQVGGGVLLQEVEGVIPDGSGEKVLSFGDDLTEVIRDGSC